MKKKCMAAVLALVLAFALAGCGTKELNYISDLTASDYVTLGQYIGIAVTETEPSVSDDDVEDYIEYFLSTMAETVEITDRPLEEGDTVNIDYVGYRDGEPFDGGSDSGVDLTLGSGTFIEGFEEGLIGAEIGDNIELPLTFPDDYWNDELAGVAVTFDITVNSITRTETPELTDELVASLGEEGLETVQDFRDYIYELFYEDAVSSYESTLENDIANAVMANCIFEEPPEKMVERYNDLLTNSLTVTASYYGLDLETYMYYYYGFDSDTYLAQIDAQAMLVAEEYIMMQAIADAEGLNLTDDEMMARVESDVLSYGYESLEEFEESNDIETYKESVMAEIVMDFLVENADITIVSADD